MRRRERCPPTPIVAQFSAGQRIGRRVPRRPALRHVGAARGRATSALPRRAARPRAARSVVHRRAARPPAGRAPRAGEGVPARPAAVAGLGNIYADEALWRARIHPRGRPARSTRTSSRGSTAPCARRSAGRRAPGLDAPRLRGARRRRLAECRTSSTPTGARASRATAAARPIERIVVGGRGTRFCPHCQRALTEAGRTLEAWPATTITEAVVLRSFAFGEADRVLHVYTAASGRVGAVAKGVRKTKSRFGGRLEPFSHVELVLHRGRGELRRSPARRSSARTTGSAPTATASRSGSSGSRRCCGSSPSRSRTSARSWP